MGRLEKTVEQLILTILFGMLGFGIGFCISKLQQLKKQKSYLSNTEKQILKRVNEQVNMMVDQVKDAQQIVKEYRHRFENGSK